jgi:hypothetical protein
MKNKILLGMHIEKKYHSSPGCLGWVIVVVILIAVGCMSCGTQRDGCGSYNKWEAKNKTFNK